MEPWAKADLVHGGVLLVGLAAYTGWLVHLARSWTLPPQGDASSHAIAAALMWEQMAAGYSPAAEALIYNSSSYPPLVYVLSAAMFGAAPSQESLPHAIIALFVASLALGWPLARVLWGRAPAWIWVSLLAGSPYFVGYSSQYLLDLPLASATALGILAFLHARSFDRVGPGVLFGLTAAAGLLIKWAWLFFLAAPAAIAIAVALWRSGPSWRARAPSLVTAAGIGAMLVGAGVAGAFWAPGKRPPFAPLEPVFTQVWVACQVGAAVLLVLALKVRVLVPIRGLIAATAATVAAAGPWYILAQPELWDRFRHESGIQATRTESLVSFLQRNADTVQNLYPFVDLLLLAAIVALFRAGPSVRTDILLALAGILSGFAAVAASLPFDARYLLPLLPLAAAAIAAASTVLPAPARWVLLGAIAAGGAWALQPEGTPEAGVTSRGLTEIRQRETFPEVTWTVPIPGRYLEVLRSSPEFDVAGFDEAMAALREACGDACDVIVKSQEHHWIQMRTFEAMGRLLGFRNTEWVPATYDPRWKWPERAAYGRRIFLVLQPCSRIDGVAADVDRWRAEVTRDFGATAEPFGSYAIPQDCRMFIDRLHFEAAAP